MKVELKREVSCFRFTPTTRIGRRRRKKFSSAPVLRMSPLRERQAPTSKKAISRCLARADLRPPLICQGLRLAPGTLLLPIPDLTRSLKRKRRRLKRERIRCQQLQDQDRAKALRVESMVRLPERQCEALCAVERKGP